MVLGFKVNREIYGNQRTQKLDEGSSDEEKKGTDPASKTKQRNRDGVACTVGDFWTIYLARFAGVPVHPSRPC